MPRINFRHGISSAPRGTTFRLLRVEDESVDGVMTAIANDEAGCFFECCRVKMPTPSAEQSHHEKVVIVRAIFSRESEEGRGRRVPFRIK